MDFEGQDATMLTTMNHRFYPCCKHTAINIDGSHAAGISVTQNKNK
jgi:hypothetical protein